MKPRLSVVMGYFNRREQFNSTMQSIERSAVKDQIEVIVADDASSRDHDLSTDILRYSFPIKLIKVPKDIRTWRCPVIVYNLALIHSVGDWILIQNPEVCHVGDICRYVLDNAKEPTYYAFPVFANLSESENRRVSIMRYDHSLIVPQLNKLNNRISSRWYCHGVHRDAPYHFCTAIHRSKLDLIGGFNNDMQNGTWYDDDDFLRRVMRVCNIEFISESNVLGIHQWHPEYLTDLDPQTLDLTLKANKAILEETKADFSIIYKDPRKDLPNLNDLIIIDTNR
jgi:hypothetical protein